MMKDAFLENKDLKGILVGGPGHTKNEFVDGNYITDQVKRKIIGIKDLAYTGEFGLQELLEKSEDILAAEEVVEEKKIMTKFFNILATKPGMVSYGPREVMSQIKNGVCDIALLSEALDEAVIEEYTAEAEKMGTTVMIISTETREGVQLRDLGKIAAILRYEIHT
jgi:peptide chain release factor subunit 1